MGRNRDPLPEVREWVVDLTAPDTSISAGPSGDTDSRFATFSFRSEPGARFECRLDGGSWSGCGSPRTVGELGLGAHDFQVRAIDAAGNTDGSPAGRSWRVIPAAAAAQRPRLITPFPVVRIAGTIKKRGARLKLLAVSATSGARITIKCRGRSCPFGTVAKKASTAFRVEARAARLVRVRKLQGRFLRAGTRIEVFVTKPGMIGKYTRFKIRGGKPPARKDRCLMPGTKRPVRCPPA